MIKVTVITVCYNAENYIEDTIKSVLHQTYQNIEYIIIDGNSTDESLDIIRKYADVYPSCWISEPDHGIYHAMNKGIERATGDYLYFLNAGDVFYADHTIEGLVAHADASRQEVLYGDILYCYPDGSEKVRSYGKTCSSILYNLTGDCINHQAILASRSCFEKNQFDYEQYKICADRVWMIKLQKKKIPFKRVNQVICKYSLDEGSASIKNKKTYDKEAKNCVKQYLSWGYPVFWTFEALRNNSVLSKALHQCYKIIFIKKNK